MFRVIASISLIALFIGLAPPVAAQPVIKQLIQVDAGNTKRAGDTFGYRITYNCSSTSDPCLNAQVGDLLPAEVQLISTAPANPTGDVAAINVTPNFMGSGRIRVQFVLISPLPAGNSGDLVINVRFPNGSTPDGTQAVNTVDGINLDASTGTLTSPPVTVTSIATNQVTLTKALQTSPANLDMPETYRLRISVPNTSGVLNLTSIGPVVDTLPPGSVFNGATPAADCQPGCVGTTPAAVTWTSPCTVPLQPNQNCDISVNVAFPSATFPPGTNATNSFTTDVTPLREAPVSLGSLLDDDPVRGPGRMLRLRPPDHAGSRDRTHSARTAGRSRVAVTSPFVPAVRSHSQSDGRLHLAEFVDRPDATFPRHDGDPDTGDDVLRQCDRLTRPTWNEPRHP